MGKMLQVRNVPDNIHRVLKVRAAGTGQSLSDYVLAELRQLAERPTMGELLARVASRAPIKGPSSAELIRRERDSR